jgi:hypothetical protein
MPIRFALLCLLLTDCRGQWVWQESLVERVCAGGKIVTEKRTTDVVVTGHTRNTVTRTDACLD